MVRDSDLSPDVFLLGTPKEVDRFLVARLRDESESRPTVRIVINWMRLLKARGDAFASHVVACHYWLYEHKPGYDHRTAFCPPGEGLGVSPRAVGDGRADARHESRKKNRRSRRRSV
ncbi:hypothetical protein [Paraburkholderia tropica]|uniref:hypothetical protein n=1 Tax=Paraburkholderia tropica TaxID=92647 RepID=UPI001CC615F7|nr:hypothetical protein [Paraburkholderia tropica]